jgi:hypothetical protein
MSPMRGKLLHGALGLGSVVANSMDCAVSRLGDLSSGQAH